MDSAHVPFPDLDFREATPIATAFDDVYFSRAGGVAETEHVFLAGNGLPQRWYDAQRFTIAELGFGTGLNFLVAWKRFRETASAGATLHYIAIEKFPLTPEQLAGALALQPGLADEAAALLAAYPLRLPGLHRIHLPQIVLTLCFGEAEAMLAELDTSVDAWFLDGFAPAKNPAMWSDEVMEQIRRLSALRATVATFTAAGAVKRGLALSGFTMRKVKGFGHKREMLVGVFEEDREHAALPARRPQTALVIGAGIAGVSVARALAERGVAVTVLERTGVASGASGNAAAVLFPQLAKRWSASAAWYFTAYSFMLHQMERWGGANATGMLRLPRHADEEAQLRAMNETLGLDPSIVRWMERDEASAQAGMTLATGAAWFPRGTWIAPADLCQRLLQHPSIMLREQCMVSALITDGEHWRACSNISDFAADIVVVAAAEQCRTLLGDHGLRLNAVGGQVSEIAAPDAAATLRSILCHKGYIIPLPGRYLVGATYTHDGDMLAVTDANHAHNMAELSAILPGATDAVTLGGRTSLRATTPDRMPYVGALSAGLYVSTGHGSRGMLSAPLTAEMIASEIMGEVSPVTTALRAAVYPYRFKA